MSAGVRHSVRARASLWHMTPLPDDRCGARFRRATPEFDHGAVAAGKDVALTPLGRALLDQLREDERFRELIDDPFGNVSPD
jgi:hypothetical protein